MLQNLEVPLLSCNQKDHQKQYISAICTRKECDEQSALCSWCMFPFHKSCEDHITFLEDLPNKSNRIENEFVEVDHLIESLIKELREIQLMYQQTVKPILEYQAVPNVTYLNNGGTIFQKNRNIIDSQNNIGSNLSLFNPGELTPQEQMDAKKQLMKYQESYNKNEFSKTIEYADSALSLNLGSYEYWHWKGMALNSLNKYELAIQCLNMALSINPENDTAWNNKGFALHQLNKYEQAIKCYEKSLSLKSSFQHITGNHSHQNRQTNYKKPKIVSNRLLSQILMINTQQTDQKKYKIDQIEEMIYQSYGQIIQIGSNFKSKIKIIQIRLRIFTSMLDISKYKCFLFQNSYTLILRKQGPNNKLIHSLYDFRKYLQQNIILIFFYWGNSAESCNKIKTHTTKYPSYFEAFIILLKYIPLKKFLIYQSFMHTYVRLIPPPPFVVNKQCLLQTILNLD